MRRVGWQANLHVVGRSEGQKPSGVFVDRTIDRESEAELQNLWIDREIEQGGFRRWFASPGAPVANVRGNHCFVNTGRMFGGEVWEVTEDASLTWEFGGLKFGGIRGINYIAGEWSDELDDLQWRIRMDTIPNDIDVLLSHAPPRGILDKAFEHYGSDALRSYVTKRAYAHEDEQRYPPLKAHFFGHIHEAKGSEIIEGTLFANAATYHYSYEI